MICLMLELNDGSGSLDLVRQPLASLLFDHICGYMRRHIRNPQLSPVQRIALQRLCVPAAGEELWWLEPRDGSIVLSLS